MIRQSIEKVAVMKSPYQGYDQQRGSLAHQQHRGEQTAAHDLPTLNRLIAAHQQAAYRLAYRLLTDRDLATAVVQRSCLQAYRAAAHRQPASFQIALMRLVVAGCWETLDRQKQQRAPAPSAKKSPGDAPTQAVNHAVAQLPRAQRLALLLIDVEGYSIQQAAEIAGECAGALRTHLGRARAHVRDLLLDAVG